MSGRHRDMGLGSASVTSLADARQKAADGKKLVVMGGVLTLWRKRRPTRQRDGPSSGLGFHRFDILSLWRNQGCFRRSRGLYWRFRLLSARSVPGYAAPAWCRWRRGGTSPITGYAYVARVLRHCWTCLSFRHFWRCDSMYDSATSTAEDAPAEVAAFRASIGSTPSATSFRASRAR